MAEGIARDPPHAQYTGPNVSRSLILNLCEDGKQLVQVTKVYEKKVAIMYPPQSTVIEYLDDYANPPDPSSACVTWCTRYLVEKESEYR